MTEEFNLSEKISLNGVIKDYSAQVIRIENVKEFIKQIKTPFCPMRSARFEDCNCGEPCFSVKWLRERIDKLAGETLTSKQEQK